jgi:hypothetical protein
MQDRADKDDDLAAPPQITELASTRNPNATESRR